MDYYSTIIPSTGSSSMANNNNNNNDSTKQKKNNKGGSKKSSNKGVVKLSTDPQSVAARERRHRISDRFKILQSLVPGGTKMDTVSMLDEAIHYVKFLKTQIWLHQTMINFVDVDDSATSLFVSSNNNNDPVVLPVIPSNDHQAPAFNYSNTNLVAAPVLQQPAPLQPLSMQDSCYGDQETIRYDAYMKDLVYCYPLYCNLYVYVLVGVSSSYLCVVM